MACSDILGQEVVCSFEDSCWSIVAKLMVNMVVQLVLGFDEGMLEFHMTLAGMNCWKLGVGKELELLQVAVVDSPTEACLVFGFHSTR